MANDNINPEGYKYGINPVNVNPFWEGDTPSPGGDGGVFVPSIVRNATDTGYVLSWTNNAGLPNPDPVEILDGVDGLDGANGADGAPGVTPDISATATIDGTTGTPGVQVTKTGTSTAPVLGFAFSGLKGEKGEDGAPGAAGSPGADGITPDVSATATVDDTSGTPAVSVTKTGTSTAPVLNFAFTGLKGLAGANGQDGAPGTPGTNGTNGVTFTPSLTQTASGYVLSWSNDGGLPNPEAVAITNGQNGATGPAGADGVTPAISASATVDNTTGTPAVNVVQGGTVAAPTLTFNFTGLKGEAGSGGGGWTITPITGNITSLSDLQTILNGIPSGGYLAIGGVGLGSYSSHPNIRRKVKLFRTIEGSEPYIEEVPLGDGNSRIRFSFNNFMDVSPTNALGDLSLPLFSTLIHSENYRHNLAPMPLFLVGTNDRARIYSGGYGKITYNINNFIPGENLFHFIIDHDNSSPSAAGLAWISSIDLQLIPQLYMPGNCFRSNLRVLCDTSNNITGCNFTIAPNGNIARGLIPTSAGGAGNTFQLVLPCRFGWTYPVSSSSLASVRPGLANERGFVAVYNEDDSAVSIEDRIIFELGGDISEFTNLAMWIPS